MSTLNVSNEVIEATRLFWREQQRARRGYRLRPVGRPRKVVAPIADNVENYPALLDSLIEQTVGAGQL